MKPPRIILIGILLWGNAGAGAELIVDASGTGYVTIQSALDGAVAGDTITVKDGVYPEILTITTDGTVNSPITLRAENSRGATISRPIDGVGVSIDGKYIHIEGFVINGNWLQSHAVRIGATSTAVEIRDCDISRTRSGDLIKIVNADNCLIENCDIYYGLAGSFAVQDDSHGISVFDNVFGLTIRNCNIHQTSGDCFQAAPDREDWDDILIENCVMWTDALPAGESYPTGWAAGDRPGENAVDTKQLATNGRSTLTVRNCDIYGWRDTNITTVAALNLKNKTTIFVERCRVYDSEVAFRIRGPSPAYNGAQPKIRNCFIYDNQYGVRFEDDVENVEICNNTFDNNTQHFININGYHQASYRAFNNVFVGTLPSFGVDDPSNVSITDSEANLWFTDRLAADYHLTNAAAGLIDQGVTIDATNVGYPFSNDFDGETRYNGAAWDIGADEAPPPVITVTSPNGGESYIGNQSVTILWTTDYFSGRIAIDFFDGSTWRAVTADTGNTGAYPWTVPDETHSGCLIRVSDASDGDPSDVSNAVFSVSIADTDSDGIDDSWEMAQFGNLSHNAGTDADGDNLNDLLEFQNATDPNDADSDSDGLTDDREVLTFHSDPNNPDSDNDGMPDGWEADNGLDPLSNDAAGDPDNDNWSNLLEYRYQSDPQDQNDYPIIKSYTTTTCMLGSRRTSAEMLVAPLRAWIAVLALTGIAVWKRRKFACR